MSTEYANILRGSCHCGNLKFELHTNKTEADFVPRTCQCGLCRSHGASWISDPEGKLVLYESDDMSRYQFGHKTSDFIIRPKCGVLIVALCEVEGQMRAVINIKAMPDHAFTTPEILTDFDDETIVSRLARRAKNWTGNVEFASRNAD